MVRVAERAPIVEIFPKVKKTIIHIPVNTNGLNVLGYNNLGEISKQGNMVSLGDFDKKVKDVLGIKVARVEKGKKL